MKNVDEEKKRYRERKDIFGSILSGIFTSRREDVFEEVLTSASVSHKAAIFVFSKIYYKVYYIPNYIPTYL